MSSLVKGCLDWLAKTELDAEGSKFEPYLTIGCVYTLVTQLVGRWCDLGCCSLWQTHVASTYPDVC